MSILRNIYSNKYEWKKGVESCKDLTKLICSVANSNIYGINFSPTQGTMPHILAICQGDYAHDIICPRYVVLYHPCLLFKD